MTTETPIRVLRIIARMNVGGPAWQSSVLTRGLPARGIETRLVAGIVGSGEEDFVKLKDPDLPVVLVPGLGRSVRFLGDLRALCSVVVQIRKFRPHIVHTHTAKAGVIGRLAAIVTRVPLKVHTFHGHLLHGYFSPAVTRVIRIVERLLARRTDALVAVGQRVRDEVLAARIGKDDQFISIAPGVGQPAFIDPVPVRAGYDVPSNALVVLFVGRLTAIKRVDRLLEAFGDVLRSVPNAVLIIAGEGGDLKDLRSKALPLGKSVRFIGWQADVNSLYRIADLVVISSDNEGMPVTLIEAAMAGVPGVTTGVGSALEVVEDGVTGRVVSPDSKSLASGLVELLSDDSRRSQMGRMARERAEVLFTSDRLVDDHAELYRRLLGQ